MHDQIDRKNHEILSILQEDSDVTRTELARRVGLTAPAVVERLKKLHERGFIRRHTAELDPEKLDLQCLAFVLVRTDARRTDAIANQLADVPGVQEVHHVAGEDCLLIKVRSSTTHALGLMLRESVNALEGVKSTRSTIVLETVKESSDLPVFPGETKRDVRD